MKPSAECQTTTNAKEYPQAVNDSIVEITSEMLYQSLKDAEEVELLTNEVLGFYAIQREFAVYAMQKDSLALALKAQKNVCHAEKTALKSVISLSQSTVEAGKVENHVLREEKKELRKQLVTQKVINRIRTVLEVLGIAFFIYKTL